VVGEEVVKPTHEIKALPQGEGENDALKVNGYFERRPHLTREAIYVRPA
jgi:hypothetical protein